MADCPACSKPTGVDLTDKTVGDQTYHLDCFNCGKCGQFLAGKFYRDPQSKGLLCGACKDQFVSSNSGAATSSRGFEDGGSYVVRRPNIANVSKNSADTCAVCQKPVYMAEKILALGKIFHRACFVCTDCKKLLTPTSVSVHEEKSFCKPCFNKISGNQGFGRGQTYHNQS